MEEEVGQGPVVGLGQPGQQQEDPGGPGLGAGQQAGHHQAPEQAIALFTRESSLLPEWLLLPSVTAVTVDL